MRRCNRATKTAYCSTASVREDRTQDNAGSDVLRAAQVHRDDSWRRGDSVIDALAVDKVTSTSQP
jgi:hypothetical protein